MKNDREFLEGIYQKAEVLKREKLQKKFPYKMYIRYSSVAAILIIIPLMMFRGQIFNLKDEIETPEPKITRMMMEPVDNFLESDYIVVGRIEEKIKYSEELTDVVIYVDNILLGKIKEEKIILSVPFYLSDEFKIGDRNLLFLYRLEDKYILLDGTNSQFKESKKDEFIDQYGNQYSLEDIKNNIKGEN